ncbi:META domain-containing protein [Petrimonas mucosa]|jgi:heat shock protein HslJ|nr:META domain-containing protein [Petrimonas mucosa]MDD3561260.1 META domain-containing protein [Petrimonas mucosa]HHT29332.1 META domain-containing protein [Petrimonas mucosa]
MKQRFLASFISVVIVLGSCISSQKTATTTAIGSTTEIAGKKWQLVELRGNRVEEKINGQIPFLQLNSENNRYAASAGCNGLGGEYTLKENNRIAFARGISTLMACDNMEVESELVKVLEMADNYTLDGDILSLNRARMAPLARFQLVDENGMQALNGTWVLDYISGTRIAFDGLFPDRKPEITFNLPETKVTGNGGCNSFNTTFTLDGNNIKFNQPVSTRMACPGNGEATFFKTLQTVSKYSIDGNTLNMIMGDIAVMRFQRK